MAGSAWSEAHESRSLARSSAPDLVSGAASRPGHDIRVRPRGSGSTRRPGLEVPAEEAGCPGLRVCGTEEVLVTRVAALWHVDRAGESGNERAPPTIGG